MLLGALLVSGSVSAERTLRVGVYHNPPKLSLANGVPSGIFGDLLRAMALREQWVLEPVPCSWSSCLELLQRGQLDLLPDVAITRDRDRQLQFHQTPVLRSWSQLYSATSSPVASLLDLDGMRVAVLKSSVQQEHLVQLVASFDLEVAWVAVESFEQGFRAVASGVADVVVANHLFGDRRAREFGFYVTPVVFQPVQLYFAARPGLDPDVLVTIDRHLTAWLREPDSPYARTMVRWKVYADRSVPPTLLYWVAGGALLGLILALALAWLLRRRVAATATELNLSELRLDTILNSVDACIYIKDRDSRYRYVNRQVCDLLGLTEEQILGQTDTALFDMDTSTLMQERDVRVLQRGERVAERERLRLPNGETHTFFSIKIPLHDDKGYNYALCGISTNISTQLQLSEQLNYVQYHDAVTGLANRKLLRERLEHAIASSARTGFEGAVLAVDLADFTSINETFGHAAGDQVLREVAARIARELSETDCAARLGSDDFAILLEDLSEERDNATMNARQWAGRLIDVLSVPYTLDDKVHATSVCVGVTMFSDAGHDPDLVLRNADLALAAAKREGVGNICFFDPVMQHRVSRRLQLEAALRGALESAAFELYLQPQVNARQQVTGGELLLRWTDPVLGEIDPAEFIPVAEVSGLIVPLGSWVLREACDLLAAWQQQPELRELSLAVNISPQQFRQENFAQQLEELVRDRLLRPELLELEITEGMLIDDLPNTVEYMIRLAALGLRFSLDDFGTGYASLSYLKRLPLFQLKIDQTFVRDLLTDNNDEVIVATTLRLGSSLGLEVIAEGVETLGHARRLRELGCQKFQGYYYGRPGPVAEWEERLRRSLELDPEK